MGVPAFFRWLSRKYPSIVVNCLEDKPRDVNGIEVPVDTTASNPNGVEFDNLYLDMNGIVHPCTHPEHKPPPKNEAEMMVEIFDAMDRLFCIVRPRRLVYMAVDGVAPRAKMNQQRSRRFRAAKEAREKREAIDKMRAELGSQGIPLPPAKKDEEHFDSNCITPGTPFMARLSDSLRYYIHDRLTNDPAWRNLVVILSDANVPGEGEHKIMDYIRRQRASPGHDPNTRHILCGADADLIMLGLATHEPYFTIIREEFVPNQQRPCELCGQFGHEMKDCQGLARIKSGEYGEVASPFHSKRNYIFIRLNVLREYLQRELYMPNLPFAYDFERVIDDWVFMCFFVGNDFLPHLPSLEIRENAIDRLINLYKSCVYKTKGYLSENGLANLSRVQLILSELGEAEDEIFKNRQQSELERKEKEKQRKKRMKAQSMPSFFPSDDYAPINLNSWNNRESLTGGGVRDMAYQGRVNFMQSRNLSTTGANNSEKPHRSNFDAAQQLKSLMSTPEDMSKNNSSISTSSESKMNAKRKFDDLGNEDDEGPCDDVRLWEDGWKERYYQSKFEVSVNDTKFRSKVGHAYVEGLCWVLRYYYQGCCSWVWYFPYHYAPFASDFAGLDKLKIQFDPNTKAIKPLEQLMSVFPAASRGHVPSPWAELMLDIESPIIDFYPSDFKVDLNGKKFAWQGVALLPFVDAKRLDNTLQFVYDSLTEEEKRRNTTGNDRFFISAHHPLYTFVVQLYEGDCSDWIAMDGKLTNGMSGLLKKDSIVTFPRNAVISPLNLCPDINNNNAISVLFLDPQFDKKFIFPAKRLTGAVEPSTTLKPQDWNDSAQKYRPQTGFTRDLPRASLADSGKRFLRAGIGQHHGSLDQSWTSPGAFMPPSSWPRTSATMPPPLSYGASSGHFSNPYEVQRSQPYRQTAPMDYWRPALAPKGSWRGPPPANGRGGVSWRDPPPANGRGGFTRPHPQQPPVRPLFDFAPNQRPRFSGRNRPSAADYF